MMTHGAVLMAMAWLAVCWASAAGAGEAAAAPGAIFLWPDGAPGARGDTMADKPRVTPFPAAGDGPFGCIIVCPGGGYGGRAPHEAAPIARWLNSVGVASFVLDYRVAPYRHPIPLGDAQRAVRLVRARSAEWHIDPKKIGILGFSAGGHLAASAATLFEAGKADAADPIDRESSRPDALIACYPVISFGEFRHHGSMVNLIGENPDPDLRRKLSLENSVTPQTPPTFLWHTSNDGGVPVENSLLFAAALHSNKVPFSLHVFPRGDHGLGLAANVPEVRQWTVLCAEWLKGIGFAAK
jgi:acetyl esterase/lipase